jgi:hypothetical protein
MGFVCFLQIANHSSGEAKREEKNLRLDVLAKARLDGIDVLGHVASATATSGDDRGLEGGRLQVLGLQGWGLAAVDNVAGAAAARRLENGGHFFCSWVMCYVGVEG